MDIKNKKIAFFDSGVGGLTVFSKMKEVLKGEDFIYFGDLANYPYGEKTTQELISISKKIFDYFKTRDVKAVVMACNTTSATAYDALKDDYDFKIYPIIQSCAKEISHMNVKRICVFATEATVNTHAYKKYINQNNSQIEIIEIACPEWVKIVEENIIDKSQDIVKFYLDKAMEHNPDKLILGCTHYPYLANVISKFVDRALLLNPADIFVQYIIDDLRKNSMLKNSTNGLEEIFVSANPESFVHAATMFYKIEKLPKEITLK